MTKADLVEQVTAAIARTSGPMISKKDCARVVDAFLDAVKLAMRDQHNIEVRGFGTFKIRKRKTRMARNPRTGDPVEVAARPVPVFKPSKELRALVAHEIEFMGVIMNDLPFFQEIEKLRIRDLGHRIHLFVRNPSTADERDGQGKEDQSAPVEGRIASAGAVTTGTVVVGSSGIRRCHSL